MPRLGISEDLRPNAFTTGWGKRALIVVTLGLLKMLDGVELEAVIAHEIAHIKNQDFHFMALISSLKAISFFNPIVYALSPAIKKERELLADSAGTTLLERPEVFGLALTKIWETSKEFPRSFLRQWISGLFIISEIRHAGNILAAHPTLESRLSSITEMRIRSKVNKGEVLKTILICGAVMAVMVFALGLMVQTYFSTWRMNNAPIGPDPFWHHSNGVPANRPTFDPQAYPAIMPFNLQGYLSHDYPWLLNAINTAIILMILLKIWGPSINLHRRSVKMPFVHT
jgi:hypothetical protein